MAGRGERGLTLIELVVAAALLGILAAAALPLYEVSVKREREIELRAALREIRRAIDEFHKSYCASGGSTGQNVPCFGSASPAFGSPMQGVGGPLQGPAGPQLGQPGQPLGTAVPQAGAGLVQGSPLIDVSQFDPESRGYPPNLKVLVEGVQPSGGFTDQKYRIRFLRRVPRDPMIRQEDIDTSDANFGWGARAYQDAPDSNVWGRQNVYDVYTKGKGTALDGSKYRDW